MKHPVTSNRQANDNEPLLCVGKHTFVNEPLSKNVPKYSFENVQFYNMRLYFF